MWADEDPTDSDDDNIADPGSPWGDGPDGEPIEWAQPEPESKPAHTPAQEAASAPGRRAVSGEPSTKQASVRAGAAAVLGKIPGRGRSRDAGSTADGPKTTPAPANTSVGEGVSVLVLNDGGGYGKTTVALLLGYELAGSSKAGVLVLDASPGYGALADRASRTDPPGTVYSALGEHRREGFVQLQDHTLTMRGGAQVLASDNSATADAEFTADDYRELITVAKSQYGITVTDCPAGMVSDLSTAALDTADVLVIVSEGGAGVRSTTWLANYLVQRGATEPRLRDLLDDAVIVVNSQHDQPNTRLSTIEDHYRQMVREVVTLGFDPALQGGVVVDPKKIAGATRKQIRRLASAVVSAPVPTRE